MRIGLFILVLLLFLAPFAGMQWVYAKATSKYAHFDKLSASLRPIALGLRSGTASITRISIVHLQRFDKLTLHTQGANDIRWLSDPETSGEAPEIKNGNGNENGNENGNDRGKKREKEEKIEKEEKREKGQRGERGEREEKIEKEESRASDSLGLSFGKRVFYANATMAASSVTTLSGLYLYSGGVKNVKAMISWQQFKSAWQQPPVVDYDAAFYNYGVHPYMGNLFYLSSRNRGGSAASSFLVSAITAASFEYIIESFTQPPSINDLIITPVLGSILGECSFRVIRHMKADHHFNLLEKIGFTLLDPAEVLRHGYKLPPPDLLK